MSLATRRRSSARNLVRTSSIQLRDERLLVELDHEREIVLDPVSVLDHARLDRHAREAGATELVERRLGGLEVARAAVPSARLLADGLERIVEGLVRGELDAAGDPGDRREPAPRAQDAPDVAQRAMPVRDQLEHERGHRKVEGAVVERQAVRGGDRRAEPRADRRREAPVGLGVRLGHHPGRDVDPVDRGRRPALERRDRELAGPRADIEQARARTGTAVLGDPVDERPDRRGQHGRPPPRVPGGEPVEALGLVGHAGHGATGVGDTRPPRASSETRPPGSCSPTDRPVPEAPSMPTTLPGRARALAPHPRRRPGARPPGRPRLRRSRLRDQRRDRDRGPPRGGLAAPPARPRPRPARRVAPGQRRGPGPPRRGARRPVPRRARFAGRARLLRGVGGGLLRPGRHPPDGFGHRGDGRLGDRLGGRGPVPGRHREPARAGRRAPPTPRVGRGRGPRPRGRRPARAHLRGPVRVGGPGLRADPRERARVPDRPRRAARPDPVRGGRRLAGGRHRLGLGPRHPRLRGRLARRGQPDGADSGYPRARAAGGARRSWSWSTS